MAEVQASLGVIQMNLCAHIIRWYIDGALLQRLSDPLKSSLLSRTQSLTFAKLSLSLLLYLSQGELYPSFSY